MSDRTQPKGEIWKYHARNGWRFWRHPDGTVSVRCKDAELHLSAAEWASVVAFVSARGETAESFQAAQRLHHA